MPDPWFSFRLSLIVASIATVIVAALGTAIGYGLARYRFAGRELVDALCTLPLVLPPTVVGFYLLELLGKRGTLGQYLTWTGWNPLFTEQAAVIAAVVMALPLMIKIARATIESIDPVYEEVAWTLGKSHWETFWLVTLPLGSRGLLAGVVLSFARALGEFGATLMLAGNIPGKTQTMPLAVYQATISGENNLAFMLVLLLTGISFSVVLFTSRLVR